MSCIHRMDPTGGTSHRLDLDLSVQYAVKRSMSVVSLHDYYRLCLTDITWKTNGPTFDIKAVLG